MGETEQPREWQETSSAGPGGEHLGPPAGYADALETEAGRVPADNVELRGRMEEWLKDCPTQPTPSSSDRNLYEIQHTGPTNTLVKGEGAEIWADGVRVEDGYLLEAKHVERPEASPFVEGSTCPDFVRDRLRADTVDQFKRYAAIINDESTPAVGVEVITSDVRAVAYFEGLMQEHNLPGVVVVRPYEREVKQ